MFNFPTWDTGWAQAFGAMLWAVMVGKALKQETRVLTLALIGAVLVGWVGVAVAPIVAMMGWPLDLWRKI
jgi:hypothetical protein